MNITTTRIGLIAAVALLAGGGIGYAVNASQPVSVRSTDVAMNAPAGEAALAHAQASIVHLDKAAGLVSKGKLDTVASELSAARTELTDVAKAAPNKQQPILVAQEAVIVHEFTPGKGAEAVGTVGPDGASAAGLSMTKGGYTKPLALSDYSISFGDLNVETQFATTHIDLALEAAKAGKQAQVASEIKAARGAITFTFNGDAIGE